MKKIAVIGSINMDLTCQADRHPGTGETISGRDLHFVPGGKGANQAVAAARLGADVSMFGCVGDDTFAGALLDNLAANGVRTEQIRRIGGISSGIAMITVANGDNAIVVIPGGNGCVSTAYLESVKESLLEADILIVQNEIPAETVEAVIELAWEHGKTLIYNPAPARLVSTALLEKVTYLTPNEHEAALLFPDASSLEELLRRLDGRLIVTLGSAGAAALVDGEARTIPTRKAKVVDTTGAGDTFNGAFAAALARDMDLEQALHFANTAASISTESYGAQSGMPGLEQMA